MSTKAFAAGGAAVVRDAFTVLSGIDPSDVSTLDDLYVAEGRLHYVLSNMLEVIGPHWDDMQLVGLELINGQHASRTPDVHQILTLYVWVNKDLPQTDIAFLCDFAEELATLVKAQVTLDILQAAQVHAYMPTPLEDPKD